MLRRLFVLGAALFNLYDAAITYFMVVVNGGQELNPIMARLIEYDPISFIAFKLLISVIFVLMYPYKAITTRYYGIAFFILLLICVWNTLGWFYV